MASLLDRINREAMSGDLVKALRLCVQLGGETGSEALREWASLELLGYRDQELPDYRIVYAPLQIDGIAGSVMVKQQTMAPFSLPEFARDTISEEVSLVQSAPQLIELERDARTEGVVRLMPPGAADLVWLMNQENSNAYQHIERMYWTVTRSVLQGVIESIRSRLIVLVAEMRAGLKPGEKLPSAEVAGQAINVAIHGSNNRVKVKQSNRSISSAGETKGLLRKSLEIAAWLAGIAVAVVAVMTSWDAISAWF